MNQPTIIVTGVTRSGTSMVTQMLEAGGMPCFGEYPDYENYQIGKIPWPDIKGRVVKVPDLQLQIPPPGDYLIIMLYRNIQQQAKSMIKFSGVEPNQLSDNAESALALSIDRDLREIEDFAKAYPAMRLWFEGIIERPKDAVDRICNFLTNHLTCILDSDSMARAVVKRTTDCLPYIMEFDQMRQRRS